MIAAMRYFITLIVLGWTLAAQAVVVAVDHTGGFLAPTEEAQLLTAGWEFSVTSPVTVDALGFFDVDADGLHTGHRVSLWTSSGGFLAAATVDNLSAPVHSQSELGDWLFEEIAPVVLAPGDYVIGAYYEAADDRIVVQAMASEVAGVVFLNARVAPGDQFPAFTTSGANDGYFGPTFSVLPQQAPEPSSILLLGVALAGLCLGRRRFAG